MDIPSSVESQSLAAALRDPREKIRDYLLFAYRDVQRSVRGRRFKLIEYVVEGKRTTQLFDLYEDPSELRNLAGLSEYSKKLEELRKELGQWREWDDWGEAFWQEFEG